MPLVIPVITAGLKAGADQLYVVPTGTLLGLIIKDPLLQTETVWEATEGVGFTATVTTCGIVQLAEEVLITYDTLIVELVVLIKFSLIAPVPLAIPFEIPGTGTLDQVNVAPGVAEVGV